MSLVKKGENLTMKTYIRASCILICGLFMTSVVLLFRRTIQLPIARKVANMTPSGQHCQEHHHVAFLKVHKAGSTTVMNILQRFGEKRSLICAIPKHGNYLGDGKTIDESILLKPAPGKSYSLLYNHVVYNRTAFRRIMPETTVYVAIIREPLDLLESAIRYLQKRYKYIKDIPEDKLSNFLANPRQFEPLQHQISFTNNRIAYDFGLSPELLHDREEIQSYLLSVSEDFDIVLLMEYFDESLILLKRKLCWNFGDIIYLVKNVNKRRRERAFSQKIRQAHKAWSLADNMFYDFFYEKLWKTIAQESQDFYMEVKEFRIILEYVQDFCKTFNETNPIDSGLQLVVEKTDFSGEFSVNNNDCKLMEMSELTFMDLTLARHLKTLKESLNETL